MTENRFDLQIFSAGENINKTTDTALSAEMKTFYDKTLITLASPYLVHDQFGQKRDVPKNGGKIIEFRKFSSLPKAMKPLTEGVTPDGSKLTVSPVSANLEQYGDYVEQTDLLELTSVDNTIVEATKQLASQAGLTMDTVVRNEIVGGTNVIFSSSVSGSTETGITERDKVDTSCLLKVKDVFKAAAELKAMNAPKIDGYYVGIIHPYVAYDLMQEAGPQWMDVQKYASPENMLTGEIGCLGGVRFVETSEAKIWRGDDLSAAARTLSVSSYNNKVITLKETITSDDAAALAGRQIIVDGALYTVASATTTTVTITAAPASNPPAANDIIYPGEGGKEGGAVFATLILGADAYGVTSIEGGGVEHIVKQKGYGNDPLNQRSSIGWKALKTAKRLVEQYIVRIESGSVFSPTALAN